MALLIEKETELGVPATYWRIPFCGYNFDNKEFTAVLHGHVSEETRRIGKRPLVEYHFTVREERNGEQVKTKMYFGNQREMEADNFLYPAEIDRIYIYDLLRNNVPFFCGAENV